MLGRLDRQERDVGLTLGPGVQQRGLPTAERSITGEATVRTDLAILWSGAGDLESAAEVLEPVFELETDYCTAGLRQQLSRVRVVAARGRSRGAGLVERIDDWCSRATAPSAERSRWHAAGTLAE